MRAHAFDMVSFTGDVRLLLLLLLFFSELGLGWRSRGQGQRTSSLGQRCQLQSYETDDRITYFLRKNQARTFFS